MSLMKDLCSSLPLVWCFLVTGGTGSGQSDVVSGGEAMTFLFLKRAGGGGDGADAGDGDGDCDGDGAGVGNGDGAGVGAGVALSSVSLKLNSDSFVAQNRMSKIKTNDSIQTHANNPPFPNVTPCKSWSTSSLWAIISDG